MEQKALHDTLKSFGMDDLDLEFANKMGVLLNYNKDTLTQEQKTKILNDAFDSVSEEAFIKHIDKAIKQVNMSEQECRKYPTSDKQLQSVIGRLPRLSNHKVPLMRAIIVERKKYNLRDLR